MSAVIEYVKEHPIQVGGIAVVAVLAIYVLSSSGGGSAPQQTASTGPGTSDAEIASGLALAKINADSQNQTNQINGSITLAAQQAAAEFALHQLDVQNSSQQQINQLTYQNTHDQNEYELGIANIKAQLQGHEDDSNVALANINAMAGVQLNNIAAGVEQTKIAADASVNNNFINNATSQHNADIAAQTQQVLSNNLTMAQIHLSDNQLGAQIALSDNQTAALLGVSGNQANVAISQSNNFANVAKAQINAASNSNILGSALGFLGGLL